jgi:hypothetical protein
MPLEDHIFASITEIDPLKWLRPFNQAHPCEENARCGIPTADQGWRDTFQLRSVPRYPNRAALW